MPNPASMPSVEILSRIQFAFTIAFHYIYPPLSIGLGLCLVLMEGMYLKTGQKLYEEITRFWIKIFSLIFGIGVATGIVMEFEFGTNWATYSRYVGDIFGSALAAEGIFAFALESGFLGILLFGWNHVSRRMHFFATIMVALGSIFSALWIVIANSWQQTPAGFRIQGEGLQARAVVTDFWQMVLNPSAVDRFLHVIIGSFLAGAFLVMSVGAWYVLKKRFTHHAQAMFRIGWRVAVVAALLQLFTGHRSATYVSRYQPAKLAAMEAHYDSLSRADLYLLGWVNAKKETVNGLKIPGGLSFLIHENFNTPVKGLHAIPPGDRPTAVNFIFQCYHGMVTLGLLMIGLTLLAGILLWKKKLFDQRWLMRLFVVAVLFPQLANQLGWYTAEVGRQPWVVYGLLRTSDALSSEVNAQQVLFSLILFTLVYLLLFVLFLYLLNKKIAHGPPFTQSEEAEAEAYSRRKFPTIQ